MGAAVTLFYFKAVQSQQPFAFPVKQGCYKDAQILAVHATECIYWSCFHKNESVLKIISNFLKSCTDF